jgi:hypothetical protein
MSQEKLQSDFFHLLMTLMIDLHHFFLECQKNVGQDSVSGIVPGDFK